jgi:hypothetical protein
MAGYGIRAPIAQALSTDYCDLKRLQLLLFDLEQISHGHNPPITTNCTANTTPGITSVSAVGYVFIDGQTNFCNSTKTEPVYSTSLVKI